VFYLTRAAWPYLKSSHGMIAQNPAWVREMLGTTQARQKGAAELFRAQIANRIGGQPSG
jgi:hypothetical protein